MNYVVEFIGHDGMTRHTQPMSKMGAELAQIIIPLETRIVPENEVLDPENKKEGLSGCC